MKALILAAGFGKRLEPYTHRTPKPLFTISNQPLLDRVIRRLASAGISSIMVNTHHLHHQIERYLLSQAYPIPVTTRYESEILGTGGAIKNLSDFWDDEPFMVVNSDILFDTDLEAFGRYHTSGCSIATLMLCDHQMFNQVWVDPENRVLGFDSGRRPLQTNKNPLTFTGIQIIHPELLDFIPANRFYSVIDAYKKALSEKKKIRAYIPDRLAWTDIGSPERYREAACQAMARETFLGLTRQNHTPKMHMQKLAGDGSDRLWYRVTAADVGIIMVDHGIRTGPETEEVDSFIRIGKHLFAKGVPVPAIILSDPFAGLVFLEDLGDLHLQEMVLQNKADTDLILSLYRSIIDQLIHMALAGRDGFDSKWTWQSAAYDPTVILEKECRYFVEAFLNLYLDMGVGFGELKSEFVFLAENVAACTDIGFMHRDMQSRNIMVHQNRCYFIDFQGGRTGPLQYDLASLLVDPYVALSPKNKNTLYDYYVQQLSARINCEEPVFREGFETCTITRNLQILGAFGNLSKNKGKRYFEAYIPGALQTLGQNLKQYHAGNHLPGLRTIVQKADEALRAIGNKL
jgi:aminoglycoside/choline kinase family phosphotransferase/UTP-glucose-1-phosphate uridylyltransferase